MPGGMLELSGQQVKEQIKSEEMSSHSEIFMIAPLAYNPSKGLNLDATIMTYGSFL